MRVWAAVMVRLLAGCLRVVGYLFVARGFWGMLLVVFAVGVIVVGMLVVGLVALLVMIGACMGISYCVVFFAVW